MWSAAVVLYVMVVGEFPFGRPDPAVCSRFRLHIDGGSIFPDMLGSQLTQLLAGMLQIKGGERSTTEEVLTHQWCVDGLGEPDMTEEKEEESSKGWLHHAWGWVRG